jgi:hypothetical protein
MAMDKAALIEEIKAATTKQPNYWSTLMGETWRLLQRKGFRQHDYNHPDYPDVPDTKDLVDIVVEIVADTLIENITDAIIQHIDDLAELVVNSVQVVSFTGTCPFTTTAHIPLQSQGQADEGSID